MIQQKQQAVEENISNITSASGEAASFSSCNRNDIITTGGIYPLQHFAPLNQTQPQEVKKKRNQPGNPDPEAEVIALSPKSLLATNRFVCEICNKGFQRDQNLQLHKRGHNLPWKLRKRTNNEVIRKKVYVCPEQSCVHHDPSRALGDLTGIKKHFCRKHGEKKWKCEKCSKRYAVQSDWKAHSKTCGAKEYRCECGTIFSRRDSFITHRAFCDALSVQSSRAITRNPIFPSHMNIHFQPVPQFNNHEFSAAFSMKKEQTNHDFNLRHDQIPPWLMTGHQFVGGGPGPPPPADCSSSIFHATRFDQEYVQSHQDLTSTHLHENPNPKLGGGTVLQAPPYTGEADAASPHISAIAMLQKAAELGATMSKKANAVSVSNTDLAMLMSPHKTHVSATDSAAGITKQTDQFGLNFSSRDQQQLTSGLINSFGSYENKAAAAVTSGPPIMTSFATEFEGSTFEDMMMTKDFLGLRPLSHTEIFNVAGLVDNDQHQFQNHVTWES